jgi:hypothetical protein
VKFRTALRTAGQAARANLLPGLVLQFFMALFLLAYLFHDGTKEFLQYVAEVKKSSGWVFAFTSYVISAAALPELLRIIFFQRGHATRANLWSFLTAAPAWGAVGVMVDTFYQLQAVWFGSSSDWLTILTKMAVDQFIYSPFLNNPLIVLYFAWRDMHFRRGGLRKIFAPGFFLERVFPVQVAGWCIWIPGVCLVYFMPGPLQFPVASLIQCFWVLIFLFVNRKQVAR